MARLYLDHNATTPLRPEARDAMIAAMDVSGNPSSVHAEGRGAKSLIERARAQVAAALGAEGADIVFVSGSTEGAALALAGRNLAMAQVEHDALLAWAGEKLPVDGLGRVSVAEPAGAALQLANSETGVVQTLPEGLAVSDLTQAFGKLPIAFNWLGCQMGLVSAHKLGGPKGIGALVMKRGTDLAAQIRGGGQEMGRRAGTENVIGIAGFGAAAEAAARDLDAGLWDEVAARRDRMEAMLRDAVPDLAIAGLDAQAGTGPKRLPNTSNLISPGWKGETQVMQMDLAGIAVSAGSACSSGKVRASKVLRAMGFDDEAASGALRVSLGPWTTDDEIERFARVWLAQRTKHRAKAA
ncbi:cysteine desulfurase [Pseudooceanicola sediminis]|uniref:Cysteine desulfurase n=1 Tax=Pseudooceanicola sediminis TaxID=2211117 RepID=A0A399J5X0_9RHOB|nr:cysteine desulfurase family protein [Pseudooceanicola sediminis]KAA2316979.1 cysteine desulfurase [Puniceibacterium sp. HSS470]RII40570.1 cysteine desulfurase [Pseudooceanicola sediminis]|tara:strand:- start:6480 stop:7541 length:1062 start_codon:yes stop_codon:yes gene_type:complete